MRGEESHSRTSSQQTGIATFGESTESPWPNPTNRRLNWHKLHHKDNILSAEAREYVDFLNMTLVVIVIIRDTNNVSSIREINY